MKRVINSTMLYLMVLLFILPLSPATEAKKRCKPLLKKLHNIQALQRNGYSLKRGQSLRRKEDKARKLWWQCEHSAVVKVKKKKRRKKSNKQKSSLVKNTSHKATKKNPSLYRPKKLVSFNQSSAIVIKSKYQGVKRQAWLLFYQQPSKCQRPKNLSEFAYCHEKKRQQQSVFEQGYRR
ncbi:hypothetical protein [Colwellia piezophila]|uniref:hypothetical protein n=1 Tax=Colwellia piezophila TaxID=211668 RepID=UPI00038145C2|nr:hypothetical protein [Colwellia piezophila]